MSPSEHAHYANIAVVLHVFTGEWDAEVEIDHMHCASDMQDFVFRLLHFSLRLCRSSNFLQDQQRPSCSCRGGSGRNCGPSERSDGQGRTDQDTQRAVR